MALGILAAGLAALPSGRADLAEEDPASLMTVIQMPAGADTIGAQSAGSPGHIDDWSIMRRPPGMALRTASDHIAFTHDDLAGLTITVSGAETEDRWDWTTYLPIQNQYAQCWFRIAAPTDGQNPTGVTALLSNCQGGVVTVLRQFPTGCPCAFGPGGAGTFIAGTGRANPSTWQVYLSHTPPGGVGTLLVSEEIYIVRTPLTAVTHGWESNCSAMGDLVENLRAELGVADERVQCYQYDGRKSVSTGGCGFGPWIREFGETDPEQGEVDIVAHSYGGLVSRYYYAHCRDALNDPAVGSISMLGTPNEGVRITFWEKWLCPGWARLIPLVDKGCSVIDLGSLFAGKDLHSDAIDDLKPGSDVLDQLNDGFEVPVMPIYRAHAGQKTTWLGKVISGGGPNDCFISNNSTYGKDDVFGPLSRYVRRQYPLLSHTGGFPGGIPFCDGSNTVINSTELAANVALDIKPNLGFPFLPAAAGSGVSIEAAGVSPEPGMALQSFAMGILLPSQTGVHEIQLPQPVAAGSLLVLWAPESDDPQLSLSINRPGGSPVLPGDGDIIEEIAVTDDSAFYIRMDGAALASMTTGAWTVSVTGTSLPADGQPYMIALLPDSAVSASVGVDADTLTQGESQIITAAVFDGDTRVSPTSLSVTVLDLEAMGTIVPVFDDGLGDDVAAGDHIFTATLSTSTLACGTYRVMAQTAANSSEGVVTREQLSSFDVALPGGEVRDPCNIDDDDDGCSDGEESGSDHTLGGGRDALDRWDFFDVTGDFTIDLTDALEILAAFGEQPGMPQYDPLLDRYSPDALNPWRTAAAIDGFGIDLTDVLANLAGFGDDCTAAP